MISTALSQSRRIIKKLTCDSPGCKREVLFPAYMERDEIKFRYKYDFVFSHSRDICKDCTRALLNQIPITQYTEPPRVLDAEVL